jgi:hypothetical protein
MPNPRAQKPLTLAQVKKDLLSFKEPLTALADMTAGGLRGLTMGTLGLPGEVESLSRSAVNAMLQAPSPRAIASRGRGAPQISEETVFPTIADLDKRFTPTVPEGAPDRKSREKSASYGEDFGKLGVLPGSTGAVKLATYGLGRGAGALTRAGLEAVNNANLYGQGPLAAVTPQVANIVKSGGGNWLRQGLDEQRLLGDAGNGRAQTIWNRQQPDYQAQYPERQQLAVANDTVADWANKNMLKYMANQMGTKDDPVRKLAEQNISHFGMRPDEFGEYPYIPVSREASDLRHKHTERTGEDSKLAESSLAQYWENLSDNAIKATTVGDIKNAPKAGYSFKAKEDIAPYADKVPPETPIYNIDNGTMEPRSVRQTLGFNRLLEVMREDIAAGRVTPEEVSKWDMEQAVRHVDKRDKAIWKAEAEEADRLAKEFARYFPTLKEYKNGSRWIELKVPDLNALPKEERLQLIDKLRKEANEQGLDPEKYIEDYPRMKLEEALAHEGEKMGHCVGSYCEDVVTGKSRVISYRDANGDPHVTLEITPNENPYGATGSGFVDLPIKTRTEYENIIRQWRRNNPDVEYLTDADINKALKEAGVEPRPDEIKQIKGKQDAAPVGRYQPYVQDFQRMTKYPIEGDFANSGFDFPATGPRGIFDEDQVKTLREAGHEVHDYLTKAEREDLVRKLYERETGNDFDTGNPLNPPEPPVDGMKAGGAVHISDNPDTMAMELQNQHYAGGGVVRGLKALKSAMRNPEALVPSARGATKFAEPAPKTMSIMKEKGGNWLGGNIAGAVDKRLKSLKTQDRQISPLFLEDWRQDLKNPSTRGLSDEDVAMTERRLNEHDAENAVNQWIERNVGNYVKKEMATPEDPVRLMLEKRAQEIEAQFQVDMNRAQRTRARAEVEDDLRRKVNLTRQAQREEEQAKFDRDFAMEHATHLPKSEVGELSQPSEELMQKRLQEGYQMLGEAKSDPAQRWENLTDEAIDITRAGDIQKQKDLSVKAQQAEEAYRQIGEEIENKYPIAFKKLMDERGVTLTENEFNGIVNSTRMNDKASLLGMTDEWKKLQSEYLQGSRQYNAGLSEIGEENPFVSKLDPETNLYSAYLGDLGIDHVVDVIKQDVAAGRIRPEQLNKLTMDQAIKRTAEFNMEQAKKMQETAIKKTEGMPTYKDYEDEGYKWVELKMPEATLPEGFKILPDQTNYKNPGNELFTMFDDQGKAVSTGASEAEALRLYKRQEREQQLADALKYEGDTMGHCVGGYCPDVVSGRSRIYSLRDKRGEPHVTIEVQPMRGSELGRYAADLPEGEDVAAMKNPPMMIRQIKGKGNARPVEKYDPYTQDFVKSGQWQHVGDLENTGLFKLGSEYLTHPEAEAKFKPKVQEALNFLETHPLFEEHRLAQKADDAFRGDVFGPEYDELNRAAGRSITPNVPYTYRELKALLTSPEDWTDRGETIYTPISRALEKISEARKELGIVDEPPVEGMKAGGKVHFSNNPDSMQMELQDQRYQVGGVVRGLSKASKGAAKNAGKEATKSAVKVANEPSIAKAPSIIIPSKLSNVKEAIRQSKGNYGAKRVERAADEIPNLERLYKEEALRQAFEGDNAKPLMTMNPADFEKYAMALPTRTITEPKSFGDKTRMSTEDYLKYLRTLPEGFDDVPFLEINKQEQGLPLMPFISGHEGRHRNRAMAESGEQSGLVRLFPRAELREGFPRKSQEEYIEALKKELEMTGNLVLPEHNRYNPTDVQRPAIDMPDIYAKGGEVNVSDNCDCMRMELDNKKFAMGGAVMNPSDVGSPSPQNSASPVPSFQAGGVVKGLAAVKQALTGGKKAATAVKPSLVIKSEPSLIVSNLIDEEPNIAKRLGAEARAKRQKAIEAEGKRQEAARQTQPSVGYRQSTEKNPDPLVGTRFVNEPAFGLNPNDPFDITKYKGGSGMVLPWDSQSRNVKTTQLSGVDLPNQVFDVTHGGIPYAFDTQHVAKGIAGASGEDISKRIKTRADTAVRENKDRGGTGELLHFPITMGYRAEDYALPYSEFSFDIINHKLMTGELTKKEADELSEMVRNFSPPKYKGKKPFAEFAGFTEPEGLNQIYTGEGLKVPSGELRKAIADRIIWQKGSQEKLGFNAEDLMNATTYEPLRGVDKGFIGSTVMRNTPTGMRLSPSAGKYPYDTDFSGEHLGRLDDLVDVEALFHRTLNPIKHELITRENLKPYNKESLRNAAIGAIEKRNEGISQPIDQQFLEDYNDYINELKKPHEYRVGGSVKAKKKYSDGGAISALMKHAETAGQSARMNNQRM